MTPLTDNLEEFNWEDFKSRLLYPKKSKPITEVELIKFSFYHKEAKVTRIPFQQVENLDSSWFWPKFHPFLEKMYESNDHFLIYEWTTLLSRQQLAFPTHILPAVLSYWSNHLPKAGQAHLFINATALQFVKKNVDWRILDPDYWKQPLYFKKTQEQLYAFKMWRKSDPSLAFEFLRENFASLKETEKPKLLQALTSLKSDEEVRTLLMFLSDAKLQTAIQLYTLIFQYDCDFSQNAKHNLLSTLHHSALENWEWQEPKTKRIKFDLSHKIQMLPPLWLSDDQLEWYFGLLQKSNNLESYATILPTFKCSVYIKKFMLFLLRQGKLTEHFRVSDLSGGLNFEDFNALCIEWIQTAKDKIDLEAFLHCVLFEKHFWSDELTEKILSFRYSKKLQESYDFDIFWSILPYKINPNSPLLSKIPAEIKNHTYNAFHFDPLIFFRKAIRTMTTSKK